MGQVYVLLCVVVAAGTIGGALIKGARALLKLAFVGQGVVDAVSDNTAATAGLSEQFRQYQQVTDRRLEILEEAHRGRRWI